MDVSGSGSGSGSGGTTITLLELLGVVETVKEETSSSVNSSIVLRMSFAMFVEFVGFPTPSDSSTDETLFTSLIIVITISLLQMSTCKLLTSIPDKVVLYVVIKSCLMNSFSLIDKLLVSNPANGYLISTVENC